tara:strand:- start:84 stop:458 length:375 start_codon:yes stop_codon:yes gene_type:complete
MNIRKIFLVGIVVLILDFIVLKMLGLGSIFLNMINKIQNKKSNVKPLGIALSYLVVIFQIYYFIIEKKFTLIESFILGFTSYAIFDLTNYTLLNKYNLKLGLIDSIWGGILYTLTNYIVNKIKL